MGLESIEGLRVFVQVVDSGGLSAAGRVLGLAPTLVSRRIARLEDEVGARLLLRTTRRLHVTDEGREFYRACRRILGDLDDAVDAARPVRGEARGRVRAVVPTMCAPLGIMHAVRTLLGRHPGLQLQLSFSDQPVDLVAGGWDVSLRVGPPPDSSHVVRRLSTIHTRLAATPEYLADRGIPQHPSELAEHECLRFISDRPQDTWTMIDADGDEVVVPVHGRLESDNSATLADALNAGLGIGLTTAQQLARGIDEGRLSAVLPGWRMQGVTPYVLLTVGRSRVARVRLVADWLGRFLEEHG